MKPLIQRLKKAYELTENSPEWNDLARLAAEAGYSSLRSFFNDVAGWNATIDEARAILTSPKQD